MERNKSDKANYAYATSAVNRSPFPSVKTAKEGGDNLQQSLFMKYASSILQVMTEDKIQKVSHNQNNADYSEPIVDISDVIRYGGDSKCPNGDSITPEEGYNAIVPRFKKKNIKKSPFIYNFTNLTTLVTVITKFQRKIANETLEILRNKQPKRFQPVKNRASFHSGTTNETINDDFRSRRQLETLKKVQTAEQKKEGANAIKGWIQFKILMIENSILRNIQECQRSKEIQGELSPIASSKKEGFIENFQLSEYHHDNELSSAPNLQQMEQSLSYTADHNFQFSRKEYTITTPDKLSQGDKALQSERKSRVQSGNPLSEAKESQVSEYKQYLKKDSRAGSKVLSEFQQKKVTVCPPVNLKINQERRYLTVRTDYHVLPFISQRDLRKVEFSQGSDMPIKTDVLSASDPELACDNVQAILKDLQEVTPLFRTSHASRPLTGSSSHQSNDLSFFTSLRDKYSKVMTEQSRASEQITQTCKIKSKTNIQPNCFQQEHEIKINQYTGFQERKAPLKIENYYFPGRQTRDSQNIQKSRENNELFVEYPRNRLDEVKQVDSILSKHQKEIPQKSTCRIEQSMVSNFAVPDEPNIKAVKGATFPIKVDRSPAQPIPQYQKGRDSRIKQKPKISINMPSNIRKVEHSPHNIHIQGFTGQANSKKNEQVTSPRRSNPYSPSPQPRQPQQQPQYARPLQVQQQYGSTKRIEQPLRPETKISPAPATRFKHNNIYQINRPLQQQQQKYQLSSGYTQQQRNIPPMSQNNQINRPVSRIFSPQPYQFQQIQQLQQHYAIPSQKQQSSEKKVFFSPPVKQDHYFMQSPVRLSHNQEPKLQQMPSNITKNTEEYFKTDSQSRQQQERAVNFNNRYYTSGVSQRPGVTIMTERPQFVTQRQFMRPQPQERKSRVGEYDRPHSSSRQSLDRLNIFSMNTPQESQIEVTNGSNPWNSRNGSKIGRPKSMNAKIHLTLRAR